MAPDLYKFSAFFMLFETNLHYILRKFHHNTKLYTGTIPFKGTNWDKFSEQHKH